MKKLLLALILILPMVCIAQEKFELTFNGFRNASDTTKDYIVVDVPNVDKATLYKNAVVYLSTQYVSPKEALSLVENENVTINGIAKNAIKIKHLYLNPAWDINYTVNLQFKDNKMRISGPTLNKITTRTGDIIRTATINPFIPHPGLNNKEIYNKKGDLKLEDAKRNLENFFNGFFENLTKAVSSKKDDW